MALGSRLAGQIEAGAMPWHQKGGNRLCARLIHRLVWPADHRSESFAPCYELSCSSWICRR